jgi:hypothetical protein
MKMGNTYWDDLVKVGLEFQSEYPITIGRGIFCALMSNDRELSDKLIKTEYDISNENDINSPKIKKLKDFLEEKFGY